ncbi:hypothetical protein ACFX2F_013386 [Malus domestica]
MLRDIDQSTTDSDRSPVISETISTDDRSYVPSELPVSMSDKLLSNDWLPAADISNELPDNGSSNDDSSNSLVQDGGIHEVNSDDSSTYQLPPQANHGKPKVQYELDMHAKAKYPINNYVSTHLLSKPYASYICRL